MTQNIVDPPIIDDPTEFMLPKMSMSECPCGDSICRQRFLEGPFGTKGRLDKDDAQRIIILWNATRHIPTDKLFSIVNFSHQAPTFRSSFHG